MSTVGPHRPVGSDIVSLFVVMNHNVSERPQNQHKQAAMKEYEGRTERHLFQSLLREDINLYNK